ncbi:hypothetical protein DFA_08324 [Cavenderia fasciculata]|uniref:CBS domain-containing protein n=1 Tax=Cavenderia fasciculata TaxID=261658 RepID=F4Q5S0_CACFS|nr:uncharacterized protein DFA_08324 [Cavenderia fasciculata]EGG17329.1 hypothetical protein DFA_08324 [Cavenderia fasciculata]|eukprot:XP_004355813.1 hypothetical protein DFA_08324 [Cavenderia fasciculata]
MELLHTLKASSPVFPNDQSKILFCKSNDPIDKGFKMLIDHNILSTPVYDEKEKRFVSFFSMIDVIYQILEILSTDNQQDEGDMSTYLQNNTDRSLFQKNKVCDIANKSKREPFIFVNAESKLDDVARLMSKNHIHRVAVFDEKGDLCNIISLSRIIECASQLFGMDNHLTSLGSRPIETLALGKNQVISITEDKKAIDAFELIASMGISGVAVVDSHQKLKGVISDHDLVLIKSSGQYLNLLYQPINSYLQVIKTLATCPKQLITCKKTDTFKEVLLKVAENKVHRIFVVDDHNTLCGVIGLNDLLEQIVMSDH